VALSGYIPSSPGWGTVPTGHGAKGDTMTVGAALVVIIAGVLIALFLSATIGWIVAAIGVVGLTLAAVTSGRSRTAL
jgi:hypothetical protein